MIYARNDLTAPFDNWFSCDAGEHSARHLSCLPYLNHTGWERKGVTMHQFILFMKWMLASYTNLAHITTPSLGLILLAKTMPIWQKWWLKSYACQLMPMTNTPVSLWYFCYNYATDILPVLATGRYEFDDRASYKALFDKKKSIIDTKFTN